jgi:hypothetical protein
MHAVAEDNASITNRAKAGKKQKKTQGRNRRKQNDDERCYTRRGEAQ